MALRPQAELALSTSYNVSEQSPPAGARYLEFVLDDSAVAWTLRIRCNSVDYEVPCSAGQGWNTPPDFDLGNITYNAKSDSGTPNLQILASF